MLRPRPVDILLAAVAATLGGRAAARGRGDGARSAALAVLMRRAHRAAAASGRLRQLWSDYATSLSCNRLLCAPQLASLSRRAIASVLQDASNAARPFFYFYAPSHDRIIS